jgi:hypothetical protein
MVEAVVFVPFLVVAVVQLIKRLLPAVEGWLTIIVALLVGALVGLVDVHIGVTDISIAAGMVLAGSAVGLNVLADKAGGRE